MASDPTKDWLPEKIGNFKVLEILGMGGMGVIYKAVQQPLNRTVALKVLPPQYSQDQESTLRFKSEAKAVSMLDHQNIVQLYDYGEEQGCRYFAMQFVDGQNLAQRIAGSRVMGLHSIIDLSKQICRGLRYAHGKDIIHRDIKPQNVLIDNDGIARLTDFGIAKMVSQSDITMTGVTVGTPEYMSPEQAEGQDLTNATDIYSLGILIYEMLVKQPPFLANNPIAVAYKQVHELPVPPSAKRKDTPKRLELIVLKALKKDRRERYESVDEMLDHLDSVDLDEKVGRTTAHFPVGKAGKAGKQVSPSFQGVEKRIVDRRSGDRRGFSRHKHGLFGLGYWAEQAKTQWISLVFIAILYVIVLIHIMNPG